MRPKLIALAVVSAFALVGCSAAESTPEPQPTVAVTQSEESAEANTEEAEEAYLVEYKQVGGDTSAYSTKELVDIGHEVCAKLKKDGTAPLDIVGESAQDHSIGVASGMAAKVTLCPGVSK